jgi:hypothetical protein
MSNKEICEFCKQEAELDYQEIFLKPIGTVKSQDKMCKNCAQAVANSLQVGDNKENGDSK